MLIFDWLSLECIRGNQSSWLGCFKSLQCLLNVPFGLFQTLLGPFRFHSCFLNHLSNQKWRFGFSLRLCLSCRLKSRLKDTTLIVLVTKCFSNVRTERYVQNFISHFRKTLNSKIKKVVFKLTSAWHFVARVTWRVSLTITTPEPAGTRLNVRAKCLTDLLVLLKKEGI